MRLEHDYYEVCGMECNGLQGVFSIVLREDCKVYGGHFPGRPVCPGVYHLHTLKECAERLTGCSLGIHTVSRCRLTAVATPCDRAVLQVKVELQPTEGGYQVVGSLSDSQRVYMEYKGVMTVR